MPEEGENDVVVAAPNTNPDSESESEIEPDPEDKEMCCDTIPAEVHEIQQGEAIHHTDAPCQSSWI